MALRNEQLAIRFVELIAEKAARNGQAMPLWGSLSLAWRRIWIEAVPAFLELGYRTVASSRFNEHDEDEEIRLFCENLTARQRLKTYRHLYALGCRIDRVERAIEKLTTSRS